MANPTAKVKNGKMMPPKIKILSGLQRGSASIKAAYAKYAGIKSERIPKARTKNIPGAAGKILIPNKAENRDKNKQMLKIPRKITKKTAIDLNLK